MTAERIAKILVAESGNVRLRGAALARLAASTTRHEYVVAWADEALADVRRLLKQNDQLCELRPAYAHKFIAERNREVLAVARALREKLEQT